MKSRELGFLTCLLIPAAVLVTCNAAGQARTPEFARALSVDLRLQGRIMWVDGTANIERIKTVEGVRDIVDHCKRAKFTTIVVDVKPVVGQVLYNSRLAEHLINWKGKPYPEFDTLGAFVDEGHKAGLEIAASLNIFSEGHKYFNTGKAYQNRDWQSMSYSVDRSLVTSNGSSLPVRAPSEPADPAKTLVYGDEFILEGSARTGAQLAVSLDSESHVAGVIDRALLGEEPLTAPEDGRLMVLSGTGIDWATKHLRAGEPARFRAQGRRVHVTDAQSEKIAAFVSPLHPVARAYEMSLLKEVVDNYTVDTIVFDRMRFANIYNDYGDLSRSAFEQWMGKPAAHWPEDVLQFDPIPGEPMRKGPLYKPWLEFRAKVIRDFAREATEKLRAIKPLLQFGVYVGSWYHDYFGVGVNWGSEKYPVRYGWASDDYNEAGYAEFLDWVSTGCYYPIPTRDEAKAQKRDDRFTVEGSADESVAAVQNAAPVYAGIYALDYDKRPLDFARAIEAAARHSQGVMIFDLSYIYDYGWWNILENAFDRDAIPPHRIPLLSSQLRTAHDAAVRNRSER